MIRIPQKIFFHFFLFFFKSKPKITKIPAEANASQIAINRPFIPTHEPYQST